MEETLEYKYIHYNNLFDVYGNLLNDREKEIFRLFYEEDLSLQEIAYLRKVSKSAIGSAIKIVEKKLEDYENKLLFLEKINILKDYLKDINDDNLRKRLENILN